LKSASKELDRLKAGWVLDREVAKATVKSAEAASGRALASVPVDELEKQLQHAKSRVAQTVLKAPFAGQVLKVMKRPGEVSNGGAILQLANTSEMHAVAEVYESEIRLVRIGQKATISSPALERELTGRVVEIGVQIYKNDVLDVDPASDTDTRVVEVRILLDDSKAAASLTHLQVDVTIGLEANGGDRTVAFDRFAK
ncbi:MAG: HlyD family efflux transporter periplasmic adaptor subunit, partial [Planctomycetia bacterium]|nr:HlyD family efflux transporter periplasmic adaptor subunit [Planctomycetia bacterium]